jgi:hypothetical protein
MFSSDFGYLNHMPYMEGRAEVWPEIAEGLVDQLEPSASPVLLYPPPSRRFGEKPGAPRIKRELQVLAL